MKNLTIGLTMALAFVALSAVALASPDETAYSIPVNPAQPGNTAPQVTMIERWVDIGADVDGTSSSINLLDVRMPSYAFTGEKVNYLVLVRDQNGADDIVDAQWVYAVNGEYSAQSPCTRIFPVNPMWIAHETELNLDCDTDKVYVCTLTVEPSWSGAGNVKVQATDLSNAMGSTIFETWTFNPALTISVGTNDNQPLTFGQPSDGTIPQACNRDFDGSIVMDNCKISYSTNSIRIKNMASPVNLWVFLAGTDFYATSGTALCPTTNNLFVGQFEWRAMSGSQDNDWKQLSEYDTNAPCGLFSCDAKPGPTQETHNQLVTGSPFDVLTPGGTIDVQMKIVWPTPCIGTFNSGSIYAIVKAV